jgi:hypothetical protein
MTHQNQRNEQPALISKDFTTFTNGICIAVGENKRGRFRFNKPV